jgi:hypothetical protein
MLAHQEAIAPRGSADARANQEAITPLGQPPMLARNQAAIAPRPPNPPAPQRIRPPSGGHPDVCSQTTAFGGAKKAESRSEVSPSGFH